MDVDGNLTVESVQDRSKNNSWTLGVSGGYGGGSGNIGVNGNMSKGSSKWVSEQTSLSGGSVNIDVAEKTTLRGAVIDSTTGDLTLATGSLEYSNIKDRNSSTSIGGGVNVSNGDVVQRDSTGKVKTVKDENGNDKALVENETEFGPDSASFGFSDSRQTNFATIGAGTIIVRDGNTDLSKLNRDVSKAQYGTMDLGVQLSADKDMFNMILRPVDTFGKTMDGLSQIAERGRKIEEQTHVVEKTGNAIEYGHFTTDDKVDTYLSMDQFEEKVKNGEPVSAKEKLSYYESKNTVGEPLSPEEQLDKNNAIIVRTKEVATELTQNILDTYKDSTGPIINAKLEILRQIDPEAAAAIDAKFAGINAAEKRQQLIQDNQYLADFKELDRSKTDAYLASQQGTPGFLSGNNTVRIGPYDVCNSDTYTTDYRNEPLISLGKDAVAIVGGASGTVFNVASNTVGLPLAVLDAGLETIDPGGHKRNAYDLWSSTNGFNGPDDALAAALKAPVIYKEATGLLLLIGKGAEVVDKAGDAERAIINAERIVDEADNVTNAVTRVGGRLPINSKYAGNTYEVSSDLANKYPNGVTFKDTGFPDFTPYSKASIEIKGLTGNYAVDSAKANKLIGVSETPANYVWHHVEDGRTMELIPKDLHSDVKHTGGSAVIRSEGK